MTVYKLYAGDMDIPTMIKITRCGEAVRVFIQSFRDKTRPINKSIIERKIYGYL